MPLPMTTRPHTHIAKATRPPAFPLEKKEVEPATQNFQSSVNTSKVSRYNNRHRWDIIMLLMERDGNICRACPVPHILDPEEIRVDHIDNSPNHNCLRNFRLSCHQRNIRLGMAHALDIEIDPERDTRWITSPLPIRQLPSSQAYVCEPEGAGEPGPGGEPVKEERLPAKEELPSVKEILDRPPPVSRKERQAKDDVKDEPTLTATMRKNKKTEPAFNKWLDEQISAGACYTYEEYALGGAHQFECSQETTQRYLNKRLNPITGDLVLGKRTEVENDSRVYVFFRKHVLQNIEQDSEVKSKDG